MWWKHVSYDPPGLHKACYVATSVNGKAWKNWKEPFELRHSLNRYSLLGIEECPNYCNINLRPGEENQWKTMVELDHAALPGPYPFEITLIFKEVTEEETKPSAVETNSNSVEDQPDNSSSEELTHKIVQPVGSIEVETNGVKDKKYSTNNETTSDAEEVSAVFKNIYFDINTSTLSPEALIELDKAFALLNKKNCKVVISGHTDSAGDSLTNIKLSRARAKVVYDYFKQKGINVKRMSYEGFGDRQLIDVNPTEEGRRKNRRVELKMEE